MTSSKIEFTKHAKYRASQRGISQSSVETVIQHGVAIHKQGLKYLYVPKSQIEKFKPEMQKGIQRLIVITDRYYREIITCYRSEKAVKKIKRKSKRLYKHN